MYVKGILQILADFKTAFSATTEELRSNEKKLKETYLPNSKEFEKGFSEGRKKYFETLQDLRSAAIEKATEIIKTAKETITKEAMKPLPDDFTSTLEALKAIGTPSETEIKVYFEKFSGNYMALRALIGYFNTALNTKRFAFKTSFDDVMDQLNALEADTINTLKSDNVSSHRYHVMDSGYEGTPIPVTESKISDFLNLTIIDTTKPSANCEI